MMTIKIIRLTIKIWNLIVNSNWRLKQDFSQSQLKEIDRWKINDCRNLIDNFDKVGM